MTKFNLCAKDRDSFSSLKIEYFKSDLTKGEEKMKIFDGFAGITVLVLIVYLCKLAYLTIKGAKKEVRRG